ncbi:hypothetical protein Hanom_Chr02g00168331 [Helianthus anomalus]
MTFSNCFFNPIPSPRFIILQDLPTPTEIKIKIIPKIMDPENNITVIEMMNIRMGESSGLLESLSGENFCCISRVHHSVVRNNKYTYYPEVISIGPYHHGNKDLELYEALKWSLLGRLIERTGMQLVDFMNVIESMEKEIRESYTDSNSFGNIGNTQFARMMVLDGLFLIELFRDSDFISEMSIDCQPLIRDLLKLENQIPFYVLQTLHAMSTTNASTLQSLILNFFDTQLHRKPEVLQKSENVNGQHLLDIFRKSFINRNRVDSPGSNSSNKILKLIRPATKLVMDGVEFKANHHAESFLDIEFKGGHLLIPQIKVNEFFGTFFLNCVALEQGYNHCSKEVTTYAMFMGCLLNTSSDVSLLSQNEIIENSFGADKEIAKFFNDVRKHADVDKRKNYLLGLSVEINQYCNNWWHVGCARIKHAYFNNPIRFIAASGAFMLLSLTAVQVQYDVLGYYRDHK